MEAIHVKQVENAMDLKSKQQVSGSKEFTAAQYFVGSYQSIVLHDGYMYWVQSINQLDQEGNSRLSMAGGYLTIEVYTEGAWSRPK